MYLIQVFIKKRNVFLTNLLNYYDSKRKLLQYEIYLVKTCDHLENKNQQEAFYVVFFIAR